MKIRIAKKICREVRRNVLANIARISAAGLQFGDPQANALLWFRYSKAQHERAMNVIERRWEKWGMPVWTNPR